jgi:hypothetical protein
MSVGTPYTATMNPIPLSFASDAVGIAIQVTVLIGALAAAYKFRVFNVLGHKFRSAVWCTSAQVDDTGRTLFVGNYVIENTGSRPLKIAKVTLELREPVEIEQKRSTGEVDWVLDADDGRVLVRRVYEPRGGISLYRVAAGERSIFPLRCFVDELPSPVSFYCMCHWDHGGDPTLFSWLYDPELPRSWSSDPTLTSG